MHAAEGWDAARAERCPGMHAKKRHRPPACREQSIYLDWAKRGEDCV